MTMDPKPPTHQAKLYETYAENHPLSAALIEKHIGSLSNILSDTDLLESLKCCHEQAIAALLTPDLASGAHAKQLSPSVQAQSYLAETRPSTETYNRFGLTSAFFDALNLIPKGVFIGDVQGELDMLVRFIRCLEQKGELTPRRTIEEGLGSYGARENQLKPNQPKQDTIVLLGDTISRGADSAGVVEFIQNYLRQHYHCVLIMGNAEARILNMSTNIDGLPKKDLSVIHSYFPEIYPASTSYANTEASRQELSRLDFFQRLTDLRHDHFFAALTPCARLGPYLFSHSGDLPYAIWDAGTNIDEEIEEAIQRDPTRFYHNNRESQAYSTMSVFNTETMKRYYHYQRHHQRLGFAVFFGHVSVPYPRPFLHAGALQALALDTDVNGIIDWQRAEKQHKILSGYLPHRQKIFSVLEALSSDAAAQDENVLPACSYAFDFVEEIPTVPISEAVLSESRDKANSCRQAIREAHG